MGTPVTLKAGALGAPATNPGFFYPVDFPPLEEGTPIPGASEYLSNIADGTDSYIQIGYNLVVEPGNMIGPTNQGVDALVAKDPNAYWNGREIVNSDFPGFSSPRMIIVPMYDPNSPPDSGRNTVTVIGLGSFFVLGMQGMNVTGIFIEMITDGTQGSGNTMLRGARLCG